MRAKRSSIPVGSSSITFINSVLSQKKNQVVFLAAGLISFAILSFFTLATTTDYSIEIFILMNGARYTFFAFFMTFITSMLIGLYAVLVSERLKFAKESGRKTRASGVIGIIAGILGSGCPMCGSFVFGLFGAPLALYGLPFQGLEIKALAIVLLAASVFLMSKSPASCKINKL